MGAVPKPIHQRLPHALKQDMRRGALQDQQIVALKTATTALQNAAAAITAPGTPGSTYSETWAQAVTTALTALLTALSSD